MDELPPKLVEWLKLPGTRIAPEELQFIADLRKAAAAGVGYGWMQQIIEWEWQSESSASWGPEYFTQRIRELEGAASPATRIGRSEWR